MYQVTYITSVDIGVLSNERLFTFFILSFDLVNDRIWIVVDAVHPFAEIDLILIRAKRFHPTFVLPVRAATI
jgi:hypothetical protein